MRKFDQNKISLETHEKMRPRVGDTLPEASEPGKGRSDEDSAPAAKEAIHRVGEPTSQDGTAKL